MIKEPKAMAEIHEIRRNLYEEEKGLSPQELLRKIHAEADDFRKTSGVELKQASVIQK